jgi:hypothetical protein
MGTIRKRATKALLTNVTDLPPTAVPTELRKSGVARLIDLRGG